MKTWVKTVLITIPVAVLMILLFDAVLDRLLIGREQARMAVCKAHLRALAHAARAYSKDYRGTWPDRLSSLYRALGDDVGILTCPSTDDSIESAGEADANTSFVYLGEGMNDHVVQELGIVLYDKPGNHEGGSHASLADGSTQFLTEDQLAEALLERERLLGELRLHRDAVRITNLEITTTPLKQRVVSGTIENTGDKTLDKVIVRVWYRSESGDSLPGDAYNPSDGNLSFEPGKGGAFCGPAPPWAKEVARAEVLFVRVRQPAPGQ